MLPRLFCGTRIHSAAQATGFSLTRDHGHRNLWLEAFSKDSATRLAIGFGAVDLSPELIAKVLATIPCVSIGGPRLAEDGLIKEIRDLATNHLQYQAVLAVLSSLRKAALQNAERSGDVASFRDALFWARGPGSGGRSLPASSARWFVPVIPACST
jgi:hypothetical protein